jgi:hypothetical protein
MTPDTYRARIAALNLSQRAAARVLGINERTSRRYALRGVPDVSDAGVIQRLAAWAEQQSYAEQFARLARESDNEQ